MNLMRLTDRMIAALSYLSMGFVGFLWLIMCLIARNPLKPYVQFHVFQSILISVAYFLLSMFCGFLLTLFSYIPLVNKLVASLTFLFNSPVIGHYSVIQLIIFAIVVFMAVTSFLGINARLPWISDIIDQNIGRQ